MTMTQRFPLLAVGTGTPPKGRIGSYAAYGLLSVTGVTAAVMIISEINRRLLLAVAGDRDPRVEQAEFRDKPS